ncbi:MAG: DUF885 family protein [Bdellovibrionota bacterium]|nr:DUF885 family protein [Bdellovibrionota bacterium]
MRFLLISFFLVSCTTVDKKPNWLLRSDQIAERFSKDMSDLYPEMGTYLGFKEYDSKGYLPGVETEEKQKALLKRWKIMLSSQLEKTKDKNLQLDLKILLDVVEKDLQWDEVDERIGSVSYSKASEFVFRNLQSLINDQSSEQRKKAAVDRFKFYMSSDAKENLIDASINYSKYSIKKREGKSAYYPFREEVLKYLENSPTYLKGVKELLEKSTRKDWQEEYKLFVKKVAENDKYLKETILPKARRSPILPKEVYRMSLVDRGIDLQPRQLIEQGRKDFERVFKDFALVAKRVAKKRGFKKNAPFSVISNLKKEQVTSAKELGVLYNSAADRLEKIIKDNKLVSMPKEPLIVRVAGDAESKASPIPHLIPPPLIDNGGVRPEFVVPSSSSGKLPYDDFSYEAAATGLTAHEGRPGHDLQFSRLIEKPVSLIRSTYAMNSVNVEGWALYAEDLVMPYLTDEEKLVAYQMRLWRIARYFLDPEVQLGISTRKEVIRIHHKRIGISKEMAELEYQRYSYRMPAQAPSYYRGLLNIRELKADLEENYGELKLKCFNDTLLSFGGLPHKYIYEFREDFKKCVK